MDIHVFIVSDHIATDIPPHAHDFFQLIYCKSGEGRITLRNITHTAQPGTVYLAAPGDLHAICNTGGLTLLECKFKTYGQLEKHLQAMPRIIQIGSDPIATQLLENTVQEGFSKLEHYCQAADANLLLFFIRIIRRNADREMQSVSSKPYAYLDLQEKDTDDFEIMMLDLFPYLEDHLSEKISLDMLANRVHFNKTYFIRRFKSLWGCTPMQYVSQLRLRNSEKLLLTTDDSVSDIAQRCGFCSVHYFSRRFHKEFGLSPQAYRLSHKRDSSLDHSV